LRHVVPINRQAGARQITTASQSNPAAIRKLPELVFPIGSLYNFLNAALQSDRTNGQPIHRQRVGRHEILQAEIGWINAQKLGCLVDLNLQSKARLWCAVSTLRAARRLIREQARPFELLGWKVVGRRLERACVIRTCDAVAAVSTAVENRLKAERGKAAAFLHT
jgi:hypothetical protein